MQPRVSREELQALVDSHAFLVDYGFRVESVGAGIARVCVPYKPHYVRPGGVIPGFIFMAAADVTMWLAIYTLLGEPAALAVTTDLRTVFLAGLAREAFLCEARVLDAGTTLLFGTAECRSQAGALVTHHAATYIRPPKASPA